MAATVHIKLDKRFQKNAQGVFKPYEFKVGILRNKPHFNAKPGSLKSYAGGPARKQSRVSSQSVAQVSEKLRARYGNFYTRPFKSAENKDILNFTKSFFNLIKGKTRRRRCENLLQAIVRNPILRGDYGSNSALTTTIKGFNRLMIDTAQFFKSILGKVTGKSRRVS